MRKKLLSNLFLITLILLGAAACGERTKTDEELQKEQLERTRSSVNYFAAKCMSVYYLWIDEIKDQVNQWLSRQLTTDPVEKVLDLRYKQDGKDYDRWTEVLEDFDTFESSVKGVSTTYGCDITLMRWDDTYICAVVTVVYADSPAAAAGLQRGDAIVQIDGKLMTNDIFYQLVTSGFLYSKNCRITLLDRDTGGLGRSLSMTAVTMYEDPVVYHSVFDVGGKKVGYLVFTSFTLRAIDTLLGVFEQFRADGVTELILDLRYNGGGYLTTEMALASMLAPLANVQNGDVYEQEVYNDLLTNYYWKKEGADALKQRFKTSFTWTEGSFETTTDTRSGHLDLSHLYAIIDSGTASASESLLVGLSSYLPVTLIGEKTHGKFCTGIMYGAEEWYDDNKDQLSHDWYSRKKDAAGWGLYVMISRYADCNGNCAAMPDGLTPDYTVRDEPYYVFGDEQDPMLRQALILSGRTDLQAAPKTRAQAGLFLEKVPCQIVKPSFGKRILNR